MQLDYQLFDMVNQLAGRSNVLDQLVLFFTTYGPLLFGLFFVWLWFTKKGNQFNNRQLVLFALTIAVITIGIDKVIESNFFRERPFVNHDVNLLLDKKNNDPSFPSNHAAGSFALAFALFWRHRKAGMVFIGLALLMALSRLYVGVHYPLDITAGMMIASLVTLIVIALQHYIEMPINWTIQTVNRFTKKLLNLI